MRNAILRNDLKHHIYNRRYTTYSRDSHTTPASWKYETSSLVAQSEQIYHILVDQKIGSGLHFCRSYLGRSVKWDTIKNQFIWLWRLNVSFKFKYIEDITWPRGDTKFLFATLTRAIIFNINNFVSPRGHVIFFLFYKILASQYNKRRKTTSAWQRAKILRADWSKMISHVWIKMISSLAGYRFIDLLPLGIPLNFIQ